MHATAIDHINLQFPADRLEEVIEFYVDTLEFETRFDDPMDAVGDDPGLFPIYFGDSCQLYVNPTDSFDPAAGNYRHVALRIDESPETVRGRLESAGIPIDSEANREREGIGAYTSYYISDPFGYTLEFMATDT